MGIQFTYYPRPDQRETKRYTLNATSWSRIYVRSHAYIYRIEIRNMHTTRTMYLSEVESPSGTNYDELGPQAFIREDWHPPFIFARAAVGTIECLVIVRYFSQAYMKRIQMGICEPLPYKGTGKKVISTEDMNKYYYDGDLGKAKDEDGG